MLRRWRLPAKVNWTLEVRGRRADGFHELRSWFLAVGPGDRLAVELGGRPGLDLAGPCVAGAPCDHRNLVLRAEAAWREAGGTAPPLRWRLEKHLPAGSGLGAGSADAAGALWALEACATRPLGPAACAELAVQLGSDVPFFLGGGGAELRGGRGERVLARASAPALVLVLAWPPFAVSTAAVFAALDAPLFDGGLAEDGEEAAAGLPAAPMPNQLETSAHETHPALREFAARLRHHAPFHLSGSGGAHFHPCADPAEAAALAVALAGEGIEGRVVTVLADAAPWEETG